MDSRLCDSCGGKLVLDEGGIYVCKKCRKKQSSVAQSENTNTPVNIPKMFTDEYLENEKTSMLLLISQHEAQLSDCKEELSQATSEFNRYQRLMNLEEQKIEAQRLRNQMELELGRGSFFFGINKWSDSVEHLKKRVESAQRDVSRLTEQINECKSHIREIDNLLKLTAFQRAENHYQMLLSKKISIKHEDEFVQLSQEFKQIGEYKDSLALADESISLAKDAKYQSYINKKKKAKSESDYQDLADQFRSMRGYKQSNELAAECKSLSAKMKSERKEKERKEAEAKRIAEEKARQERERQEELERKRKEEEERKLKRQSMIVIIVLAIVVIGLIVLTKIPN